MKKPHHPKTQKSSELRNFVLAALFGVVFGFLLQKGGVAKFHILIGALLLQDFTVPKVMLTAILVGMIGVFALRAAGLLELQVKPTRLGSNIIGGLIFGTGFAASGYCPGTGAVALGQLNGDALFMMAGMVVGSVMFAAVSGRLDRFSQHWGNYGKLLLPDLMRIPMKPFLIVFGLFLAAGLWLLERFTFR